VIAKLDRVNAFGTLDRTATRRAVSIVAPGMLHLFDLMYGGPIAAFSPTGTIEVRRGFLQGDPSVPGYYTIASLGPAQQLMRELGDDLNALRGFLDDTALAAKDAATVEHLKIRLAELEAPLGLRMDDAKCESSVPAAGFHVAPERDGLRILGATVGTDAAVERAALAGATRIVAALDELRCADDVPRHVALYVTKYSLAAPAASHLLRTTPPPQARCAAEQIDTAVARMLASLAGTAAEAPPLRGIADWPTSQGGLGLTPCAVASGPAYLGGLAAAEHAFKAGRRAEPQAGGCICGVAGHTACTRRNRLCRVCCALRSACGGCAIPGPAELWDKHPVAAGLVRDAVRTALAETGADAPYDNWITHAVTAAYCRADTQRALTRAVLALRRQVALRAAPQWQAARVVAHGDRLSRAWLAAAPARALHLQLSDEALRMALRQRLLLPTVPHGPAPRCIHASGNACASAQGLTPHAPYPREAHHRLCKGGQSANDPHNGARDALYVLLRHRGAFVRVESAAAAPATRSRQRPADVEVLEDEGGYLAVDITRADVDAKGAQALVARLADGDFDAALRACRAVKHNKYATQELRRAGRELAVLPLAMPMGATDSGGHQLIARLARTGARACHEPVNDTRREFYAHLSVRIHAGLASQVAAAQARARDPALSAVAPAAPGWGAPADTVGTEPAQHPRGTGARGARRGRGGRGGGGGWGWRGDAGGERSRPPTRAPSPSPSPPAMSRSTSPEPPDTPASPAGAPRSAPNGAIAGPPAPGSPGSRPDARARDSGPTRPTYAAQPATRAATPPSTPSPRAEPRPPASSLHHLTPLLSKQLGGGAAAVPSLPAARHGAGAVLVGRAIIDDSSPEDRSRPQRPKPTPRAQPPRMTQPKQRVQPLGGTGATRYRAHSPLPPRRAPVALHARPVIRPASQQRPPAAGDGGAGTDEQRHQRHLESGGGCWQRVADNSANITLPCKGRCHAVAYSIALRPPPSASDSSQSRPKPATPPIAVTPVIIELSESGSQHGVDTAEAATSANDIVHEEAGTAIDGEGAGAGQAAAGGKVAAGARGAARDCDGGRAGAAGAACAASTVRAQEHAESRGGAEAAALRAEACAGGTQGGGSERSAVAVLRDVMQCGPQSC